MVCKFLQRHYCAIKEIYKKGKRKGRKMTITFWLSGLAILNPRKRIPFAFNQSAPQCKNVKITAINVQILYSEQMSCRQNDLSFFLKVLSKLSNKIVDGIR